MRNQLVLDLGRPEVRQRLFDQLHALLAEYPIEFVKWDHNRPLIDGGSAARGGAAGVHAQTLGFYELLDRLRAAHPDVEWESCASGGARIDLAVLERAQRVWTSDMTDALSRQQIQRWTGLLVPPEYLGAHISAPVNHQTGRQFSLDLRAGTAFFGDLGVEWDVSQASAQDRARLAEWIALYKQHRPLLHGGRTFRVDTGSDAYWIHGVVSADRSEAVLAYVQLDEAVPEPVPFLVPGLDPTRCYLASELTPAERAVHPALADYRWAGDGLLLSGAVLAGVGLPPPQRWPASALLVQLQAQPPTFPDPKA
jgi:alpha-galactosidase